MEETAYTFNFGSLSCMSNCLAVNNMHKIRVLQGLEMFFIPKDFLLLNFFSHKHWWLHIFLLTLAETWKAVIHPVFQIYLNRHFSLTLHIPNISLRPVYTFGTFSNFS